MNYKEQLTAEILEGQENSLTEATPRKIVDSLPEIVETKETCTCLLF